MAEADGRGTILEFKKLMAIIYILNIPYLITTPVVLMKRMSAQTFKLTL